MADDTKNDTSKVDAKAKIRADQSEKMKAKRAEADAKRFMKLNSELIKNREANSTEQGFIKNQLSTNAKKQLKAMGDLTKPSSLIKAVGLASGSPFVAIMGSKLGDLVEMDKEAKEARKGESHKLADLLKKNGKSSNEIAKILEDTRDIAGDNEDALFTELKKLGFKDKEVFDKFLEIKKAGDEKLIASNFDIVQGLKEKGVEEKEQATVLRTMLQKQREQHNDRVQLERDKNGQFMSAEASKEQRDQLAEQKQDEATRTAENQSEAVQKLVAMTSGISESLKDMAEELSESKFGLGTIAGLIAAPIFILIGFFEGIAEQLKWLDDFSKGKLTKVFAPLKNFFTGLKELKIVSKFPDIGKMFGKLVSPFVEFFKYIKGVANVGAKFGSQFGIIAKFAQGFGKLLGKLFIPFQIIMGAFDLITGFIDGYDDDGIIGGIKGAFKGLVNGLIGGIAKMLAGGLAWILNFLGFSNLGEELKTGVDNIFEGIYNMFNGFIDLVVGIFTLDPTKIFGALTSIATSMLDILFAPVDMFIGFLKDVFSFAGIDLPTFDVTEFLKGFVTDAISGIKNFFGFGTQDDEIKKLEQEKRKEGRDIKTIKFADSVTRNGVEQDAAGRQEMINVHRKNIDDKNARIAELEAEKLGARAKDFFKGVEVDTTEQEELVMFSDPNAGKKIAQVGRVAQQETQGGTGDVSTMNNTSISNSTNNVVQSPNMSTGTDDRTFADAVMGA
jgi:hypothetical protein